jgi:hypothetical protein
MHSISSEIFSQSLNLENFIPTKFLNKLMEDCQRVRAFDPISTLHCFMLQVLNNGSCKEALAAFNSVRIKNALKISSMNSAAYCKARRKLNLECLQDIALETGKELEEKAVRWRWKTKEVFIVDGTIIQVEDTEDNRSEYPIVEARGKQLGQPKARMLACIGLASGALVDAELGKYSGKGQSEVTLFRRMLPRIKEKSIVLLDRFFTSFFLQSEMRDCGVDYVIRGRDEFVKRFLGSKKDLLVKLKRPDKGTYKYDGDYLNYPDQLLVRMIKSTIHRKGYRSATLYLMTSFIDQKKHPKNDIEYLYTQRWNIELDIRNFKISLGGSFLMTKSPEMAKREIWVRLIAYNFIRKLLHLTANKNNEKGPRKWSFKTAISLYRHIIFSLGDGFLEVFLDLMGTEKLNSKYRREPRALKKRPHRFCFLTVPRKEAQKENWGYARRSGRRAFKDGYGQKP